MRIFRFVNNDRYNPYDEAESERHINHINKVIEEYEKIVPTIYISCFLTTRYVLRKHPEIQYVASCYHTDITMKDRMGFRNNANHVLQHHVCISDDRDERENGRFPYIRDIAA